MYGQGRELEIGNATSAVLISLLQTLVDKDVVSNTDVRALLTKPRTISDRTTTRRPLRARLA